ncbi:DNA-3-methyladenine glycosylase [Niabella yanshanensis]|uniref:Putative 3-methyladenine DNA glycosylase n=1 Tax=Niabella yanshanensis TaxID=577386 RepID=A0ABZ0W8X9_9BACT|nr:DNA-3-methyladenine glycosylase [Niabella yanshanensis]WQD39601.1 DNA-3-methyladenine glycosylase [Niabella yanshanensis]
MKKLDKTYYSNQDVLFLAKDLLGKVLVTRINGEVTSGIITETEAYAGVTDKASHAYGGRRTNRTEIMYQAGGVSYVYLCYGIHYLFNVVTFIKDEPHAILIRAVEPLAGKDIIEKRRNRSIDKASVSAGPGSVSKALGIDLSLNAKDLTGQEIWIEDHGFLFNDNEIVATPRVGVDYAGDHALLPWRFFVRGNRYISKPNKV